MILINEYQNLVEQLDRLRQQFNATVTMECAECYRKLALDFLYNARDEGVIMGSRYFELRAQVSDWSK